MIPWLGSAWAASGPATDPTSAVEASGSVDLRAIQTVPDELVLDPDGSALGWGPALDTRLRARGALRKDDLRAELELDLLSGQLLGATWAQTGLDERGRDQNDALTAAGVVPRVAMVGARLPVADVQLGLQTSGWGLGLLANDGAADPLFGRTDFGDRVLRLRVATAPIDRGRVPLYVVLAGDRVVADELARWSDGDEAWQTVAAVLYRDEEELVTGPIGDQLGVYGVVRHQRDAEELRTTVGAVDGFASTWLPVGSWPLRLAAEGVLVTGHTEAAASYAAPDGLAVRTGGLAFRSSLSEPEGRLVVHARAAYASGDRSPDDGRVGDLRFDRDYDVGFVLFDELMSALDLGAYAQATDPSVAGQPPPGVDTLVAEGAFHQAFALQPAAEVAPTRWLALRAGAVLAWSTGPIAQPFATFQNGGVPTNHLGEPTSGRYLGAELDWGLSTRPQAVEAWDVRPSVDLQVGHAWPSASLAPEVGRLDHLLLVARVDL